MGRGGGGGSRGGGMGGSRGGAGRSSFGGSSRGGFSGGPAGGSRGGFSGGPGGMGGRPGGFGPRPPVPRPPVHMHVGGPGYHHPINRRPRRVFPWFLGVIILLSIVGSLMSGIGHGNDTYSNITQSTVEREALPANSVNQTEYYYDGLGWISSSSALESGLYNFFKATGVQPYIYLTDNIAGDYDIEHADIETFANDLYDELFTDEAHALLVWAENDEGYVNYLLTGVQAKGVVDDEAVDIILDYLDMYYYSDLSDEAFFSTSFDKAADRMMAKTPISTWVYVTVIIVVVAVVGGTIYLVKFKAKKKKEEDERLQEILNTDLGTFETKSSTISDLENKYK